MDIKQMTEAELKVLFYDQMVVLENAQNNIQILKTEIQSRAQEKLKPKAPVAEEKPAEKVSDKK